MSGKSSPIRPGKPPQCAPVSGEDMVFSFGPFSDAVGVEPDPPGTEDLRFWCGGTASTPSESSKSGKGKDHGGEESPQAPMRPPAAVKGYSASSTPRSTGTCATCARRLTPLSCLKHRHREHRGEGRHSAVRGGQHARPPRKMPGHEGGTAFCRPRRAACPPSQETRHPRPAFGATAQKPLLVSGWHAHTGHATLCMIPAREASRSLELWP